MSGFLAFCYKYRDEQTCIAALADLRWPDGFTCDKCQSVKAYHLEARPRIFECAACGFQDLVTAGTILHKTRTPLRKWFMAVYLIGHDKRGVSAMFISREFGIRYATAWLMCHKLRHALTETDDFKLDDLIEVDEAFYGGRRQKGNRGRAQTTGKAMVVCAVEKRPVSGKSNVQGHQSAGIHRGWCADRRAAECHCDPVGQFHSCQCAPWYADYLGRLHRIHGIGRIYHSPIVQGTGANAGVNMPVVHKLFSNIKTWLNGTYHGVSTKHLPRYLREWSYRFNRRHSVNVLDSFVMRRAVNKPTITYAELVSGLMAEGAA